MVVQRSDKLEASIDRINHRNEAPSLDVECVDDDIDIDESIIKCHEVLKLSQNKLQKHERARLNPYVTR